MQQQNTAPQGGLGLTCATSLRSRPRSSACPRSRVPVVTSITPGSTADRAGLKPGDVIVEADGVASPSVAQVQQVAQDGVVVMRLKRDDATFYTAVRR